MFHNHARVRHQEHNSGILDKLHVIFRGLIANIRWVSTGVGVGFEALCTRLSSAQCYPDRVMSHDAY